MKQEEFNTLVKFLEEGVQYEIDFCNNPKESYQMFSTKLIRDFERLAQTMVVKLDDNHYEVQVVSWYDNENSYTSQMVRTIKYFAELGK